MHKYFIESYILTIAGLILAFFWGEHVHPGTGLMCVFIAGILAILEISLSFDNAVVNAMKLEHMTEVWQKRFLTWGIAIAVFGMRFIFPILVVSIFAHLSMGKVLNIALTDANKYAMYLQDAHEPIVTFGGIFLIMLFLSYFFNHEKTVHWIKFIEKPLSKFNRIKGIEIIITVLLIAAVQYFIPQEQKTSVIISGIAGLVTFIAIDQGSKLLEKKEDKVRNQSINNAVKKAGLVSFIYLELIDASFSLDGVLGAFALSSDVVIIAIGLGIGAMFVRSLTMLIVETKTLAKFLYLEHGAHWAIGALAIIMLISTVKEVPSVVTGLIGLVFIVGAFISSLVHNKNSKTDM